MVTTIYCMRQFLTLNITSSTQNSTYTKTSSSLGHTQLLRKNLCTKNIVFHFMAQALCLSVLSALVPPGPRLSTWAVDKRGYKKNRQTCNKEQAKWQKISTTGTYIQLLTRTIEINSLAIHRNEADTIYN